MAFFKTPTLASGMSQGPILDDRPPPPEFHELPGARDTTTPSARAVRDRFAPAHRRAILYP